MKFCFIQGEWENCWLHLIIFVLYLSWLDESIILLVTSTCLVVNSPVSSISFFFTLGQGQQFSYQKSSPLCNLDFDDISIHFPSFPHHFTIHLRKRLPPNRTAAPPHRRTAAPRCESHCEAYLSLPRVETDLVENIPDEDVDGGRVSQELNLLTL